LEYIHVSLIAEPDHGGAGVVGSEYLLRSLAGEGTTACTPLAETYAVAVSNAVEVE
jgi:hypothetical protein